VAPKTGAARTRKAKRSTKKTANARRGAARPARAARSGATSKTARRKTAARAAASRSSSKKSAKAKSAAKKKTGGRATRTSRVAAAAAKARGVVAGAVQAVVGSFPWSADENDPIALLESDHRRFENLLKQGEETSQRAVKARTALLDTLTAALNVHELIEEQVLYPALKPHEEARDIVLEGFQEHHVADLLVKELHEVARDDEQWGAKFKVLAESLEHHIEEEEGTMFPAARRVLSAEELQTLGARMRTMKAREEGGR
jgi:hemerythrin-like domain-containing protein